MSTKYIASNWRLPNQAGVDSYLNDNYGLTFDGTEYIEGTSEADTLNNLTALSVSMWINQTDVASFKYYLSIGNNGGSPTDFLELYSHGTASRSFNVEGSIATSGFQSFDFSSFVSNNTWFHLALVWDSTQSTATDRIKIYIDGVLRGSLSGVTSTFDTNGEIKIGRTWRNTSNTFDGSISEVAIFDYALSEAQISTLYGSSSLGSGNPMALPTPVAYYPLGDNSSGNPLTQPNEAVEDASVFDFANPQFIDAGNASYLNGLSEFTLSCWFKLDTAANNNTIISDWMYNQIGGKFALQTTDSSGSDFALLIFIRNSVSDAGNNIAKTDRIFTQGNWYNLIFSFNSSSCQFYINGSPVTTTITGTIPTNLLNENGNLNIGKFGGNLTRYFNGEISNVAIWNSDQSSEISNIYNSGVPATTYTNTPTAWYKLDQSANWEADSSGAWQIPDSVSAYPQSFDFDGSNDFISLGSDISFGTNDFSVSAWINTNTSTNSTIIGNSSSSSSVRISSFGGGTLNVNGNTMVGATISTNQWVHFLITRNGTTQKAFINGVEKSSVTNSATVLYNRIGHDSTYFFNGEISNVAFWSSDQSSEASNIYNSGVPAVSYTNTPTAWYKLNNTATFSTNWSIPDASGNGNTGTSSGMTEQNLVNNNVSALNGESSGMTSANLVLSDLSRNLPYDSYSFDFDGTGNYIDCGSDSSLSPASFSLSVWAKSDLSNGSWITKYASENYGFGIYNNNIYLHIKTSAGWGGLNVTASSYLTANNWHHIVGTYDETDLKIYVDGNLAGTLAKAGPITYSSRNTRLGNLEGTSALDYDGFISNVSIFDEALTSTEVMKLYSNGMPQDLTTFTPAPVAWWTLGSNSFFNGTNFICKDLIGSNDGTSVNAGVDALQGNTPRSEANGTGTNNSIPENLVGTTKYSSNNSWSINMSESARVADTP